jgi:TRAP-type transport system periplasmic protein
MADSAIENAHRRGGVLMIFCRRHALGLSVVLTTLLSGTAWGQAKDLTMGNVNPPNHGTSQAAQQFIDKLAELSGGKIKVVHHHSGALGGEREVAQQIQLGAVDMGPITTAPLSTLVPEMSVFQLPYIFRDYEHVFKALDGDNTIVAYYDGVLDKKGLKLIGFIAAGYRGIYGHAAINGLDDVKGKKVRVQEDRILVATFKALGMISTPIAFPEVATALQTKVIDFAEGGVNTFYHNKFYDIVKYVADVRHTHQATALIMAKASYAKQDAAGQKAIADAWAHARAFNRKFILDEDKTIQDQVKAKGVTITKPDATPVRNATASVYEDFYATGPGKDAKKIVDHILAVK